MLDDRDAFVVVARRLSRADAALPNVFCEASSEVPELGSPGIADILMFNAMHVKGFVLGGQSLSK